MALSKRGAPTRNLVALCDYARSQDIRVSEMPPYAGVTSGGHSRNSWHYDRDGRFGQAADFNFGPAGTSKAERDKLELLAVVAVSMGLGVIYALHGTVGSAYAHRTHLHADVGSVSNLGRGAYKRTVGDLVVWDTQPIVHTERDNLCGPHSIKRLEAVQAASNRHGVKFPHGVQFAQEAVGTKPDGDWGPKSRAAHDRTVNALQHVWKPARLYLKGYDTVWGSGMDQALSRLLAKYRR